MAKSLSHSTKLSTRYLRCSRALLAHLCPLPSSTRTMSCQILVASAKTFEEFVDEQLREDGSGQVLRREGGTGLLVPSRKTLSQAFIVAAGCCLCWEFRVKVRKEDGRRSRTRAHYSTVCSRDASKRNATLRVMLQRQIEGRCDVRVRCSPKPVGPAPSWNHGFAPARLTPFNAVHFAWWTSGIEMQDHDLGFALRRRSQGMGGSTEEDIFEFKR